MKAKSLLTVLITAAISFFALTWLFPTDTFAVLTCSVTSSGPYWIGGSFEIDASGFMRPDSNYEILIEKDPDKIVQRSLETFVPSETIFPHNVLLSSPPLVDPDDLARWFVRIVEKSLLPVDANNCAPTITIDAPPPGCPAMPCTFSESDLSCPSTFREVSGCRYGDPDCPTTPVYPDGQCVYAPGCSTWICYVPPPESCSVTRDSETSWTVNGSGLIPDTDYQVLLNKKIYGGQTTDSKGNFIRTNITPFGSGSFEVDINKIGSGEIIPCGTIDCPLCGGAPGKNPCAPGVCNTAIGNLPFEPLKLAGAILKIGISLSGGIALILMVIGSIRVLTSSGDQKKLAAGRDMIVAAAFGLLFLIFSILILRFIGFSIVGL